MTRYRYFVAICVVLAMVGNAALAESMYPPRLLSGDPGAFGISDEICGDGVDQDGDGVDRLCPGDDRDRDGYPSDKDCDDSDRYMYPGIARACEAGCGGGTQTCGSDGSFSACVCEPLCEATGSGRCFYIDATNGSDESSGTFDSPWKTYTNVVSHYLWNERPAGWVELQPGDVVYFMSGTYDLTYTYDRSIKALFFRGFQGTNEHPITLKAYPGELVTIAPVDAERGVELLQCSHFLVEGLEITGGYNHGLRVDESVDIELRNLWIHGIDGTDNENTAGVLFGSSYRSVLHHSLIHDNYDRTNADTGGVKTANSRNVVLFRGGDNRLHHNVVFQTPPTDADKTGTCVGYKHASTDPNTTFEVDHNVLWNCAFEAISTATANSHIHHNLILDSDGFFVGDLGGPVFTRNNLIELNTVVGGYGLRVIPSSTDHWEGTDDPPIGSLGFERNLVLDVLSYDKDRGIVKSCTYCTDELYEAFVGNDLLSLNDNCYFNPNNPPTFNLFNENDGGNGQPGTERWLGGVFGFAGWQAQGFDAGSALADPQLDADFLPHAAACAGTGWRGDHENAPEGQPARITISSNGAPSHSASSVVGISMDSTGAIHSLDLELEVGTTQFSIESVSPIDIGTNCTWDHHRIAPGLLRLSAACPSGLTGSGNLLAIELGDLPSCQSIPLYWSECSFDEGEIPCATAGGAVGSMCGVSGAIRYGSNGSPVAGVEVLIAGGDQVSTTTAVDGTFSVSGTTGSTTIVFPQSADTSSDAVSALDAAIALQLAVGKRAATPFERTACDVTGDGSISAFDATKILQYKVGLIPALPMAEVCNGPWVFDPVPAPAENQNLVPLLLERDRCVPGQIELDPLNEIVPRQDFEAALLGDCSGNWGAADALASLGLARALGPGAAFSLSRAQPDVRLRSVLRRGRHSWLALEVSGHRSFRAMEVALRYDPRRFQANGIRAVGGARRALFQANFDEPGLIRVALASPDPIADRGKPIVILRFVSDRPFRGRPARLVSSSIQD